MSIFFPHSEIKAINLHLCEALGATAGYVPEGEEALANAVAAINDGPIEEVAARYYARVCSLRPFVSLNEATAFGAINALCAVNFFELPEGCEPPLDILMSREWDEARTNVLTDWLRSTIVRISA